MNRKRSLAILLILVLAVCSCAGKSAVSIGYRTMLTAGTVYEQTMSSLGDLYKQGKLSEADKVKAIELAHKFQDAYWIAVDALEAGNDQSIPEAIVALGKLVRFVGQFMGGNK